MIEYVTLALLGCLLGVITGLTPGLHVNTIAIIGISIFPSLNLSPLEFTTIMVAMAVTHTFLDFIPAIFLGVPEESTALNVLPMHKLVIQGKAMGAVKLTAYGSLLGLGFALLLLIPMVFLIPIFYYGLRGFIVYILMIAVLFLVIRERNKIKILWAVVVFFLSGFLGILMFDLKALSATQILFPVFVGLFGFSNILFPLKNKTTRIPQKNFVRVDIDKNFVASGFLGSFGGMLVGILPAMSPSQVGVLIYEIIGSDIRNFIVSVSAINTSDAIYSFISLYTIHNPRSGVATMVGKIIDIDFNGLLLIIGVIAFSAFVATIIHIRIGRIAMSLLNIVDYKTLSLISIILILSLVYIFTGFLGIYILLLSTSIGLLSILTGISRTHSMGVLLLPTILYFLGV